MRFRQMISIVFVVFFVRTGTPAHAASSPHPLIQEYQEFTLAWHNFKLVLSADGQTGVIVTCRREKDPVYGPAITSSEIWLADFANRTGPELECRFPGLRIPAVAISEHGDLLMTAISDKTMHLFPLSESLGREPRWSKDSLDASALLVHGGKGPYAVAEGSMCCDTNHGNQVYVQHNGQEITLSPDQTGSVRAMAYCSSRNILVLCFYDGAVDLWNLETRKLEFIYRSENVNRPLEIPPNLPNDIGLSADGKYLAVCGQGSLSVWDLETGKSQCDQSLVAHRIITGCQFISKDLLVTFQIQQKASLDAHQNTKDDTSEAALSGLQFWQIVSGKMTPKNFIPLDAWRVSISPSGAILWAKESDSRQYGYGKLRLDALKEDN